MATARLERFVEMIVMRIGVSTSPQFGSRQREPTSEGCTIGTIGSIRNLCFQGFLHIPLQGTFFTVGEKEGLNTRFEYLSQALAGAALAIL